MANNEQQNRFGDEAQEPLTQKIVDFAPDALEPVIEPVLSTTESGVRKAAKLSVETCQAIGGFFATAAGVLLTGEAENPFEDMFKKKRRF